MQIQQNYKKAFAIYLVKFATFFCICYFGTRAVIGLSAPGGYYSSIVHNYFDYISLLRNSLLQVSKFILQFFNYTIYIDGKYLLKVKQGYGVRIVYSCLGYGIMSFWVAFIAANKGTLLKKLKWVFGGLLLIWLINITRISMLLVAINSHWPIPFFNHHTWFNIVAYLLVFILIYFYDRSGKGKQRPVKMPVHTLTATNH